MNHLRSNAGVWNIHQTTDTNIFYSKNNSTMQQLSNL